MNFAFHTICWGQTISRERWPNVLDSVAAAGFRGIEVFQAPDSGLPEWSVFARMAKARGIEVVGLCGGSMESRMSYLRPNGVSHPEFPEPYLYVEDWCEKCQDATDNNFQLALHFHHMAALDGVEQVRQRLRSHARMKWIPDTAHLYIARRDDDHLIEVLTDSFLYEKMASLHLKDWTSIFGRFSHRYARGFRPLGKGEIKIEALLRVFENKEYKGWVVVELDFPAHSPEMAMWECAKFLEEKGFSSGSGKKPTEESSNPLLKDGSSGAGNTMFLVSAASRMDPDFFDLAAGKIKDLSGTERVGIFSDSSRAKRISPLGSCSEFSQAEVSEDRLRLVSKLARESAEDRKVGELVSNGIAHLLVPIHNLFNPNQVRLVVLLSTPVEKLDLVRTNLAQCQRLFQSVAHASDIYVTELCLAAGAEASRIAGGTDDQKEFLNKLAGQIKRELSCEGATIFLVSEDELTLTVGGTTGIEWDSSIERPSKRTYKLGEGATGGIAKKRTYRIYGFSSDERNRMHLGHAKSEERVDHPEEDRCLSACFFGAKDELVGLIRCRNRKLKNGLIVDFSEEDLAELESIFQSAVPIVERMREDKRRADAVNLLSHEISLPFTTIKGALQLASKDIAKAEAKFKEKLLRYDYLEESASWTELGIRQLKHFEMFINSKVSRWVAQPEPVRFFSEVVAPSVRQVRPLLVEKGLGMNKIDYGSEQDWIRFPIINVDRNMIEQVVFNFLSNAIKYAEPDPKKFQVRIFGNKDKDSVHLVFEDEGVGVSDGWEEEIFEEGARDDANHIGVIPGHGLGLWVVRKIIHLHKGTVRLENKQKPTRFIVRLPFRDVIDTRGRADGRS